MQAFEMKCYGRLLNILYKGGGSVNLLPSSFIIAKIKKLFSLTHELVLFNPMALRMAKILWNSGCSENNRVSTYSYGADHETLIHGGNSQSRNNIRVCA